MIFPVTTHPNILTKFPKRDIFFHSPNPFFTPMHLSKWAKKAGKK